MSRKSLSGRLGGLAGGLWAARPRRRYLVVRYDYRARTTSLAGRCWTAAGAEHYAARLWIEHIRTCPSTALDRYRWSVAREVSL